MADKHIDPRDFRYVSPDGGVLPDMPGEFLPSRKSPVLCMYDLCELLESYNRRLRFPQLSKALDATPGLVRAPCVPCGVNRPASVGGENGGIDALCSLFRTVFESYTVKDADKLSDAFLFLDPDVDLDDIAGAFDGHYVGRSVASTSASRSTKSTYTPEGTEGRYNTSTTETDPSFEHAEEIGRKTVPEQNPLPCVNDFTWDTGVVTKTVNGVQVRLPSHHLHYAYEDKRGENYGGLDTAGIGAKMMHFYAAAPFLPTATRTHKKGDVHADPDLVDQDGGTSAFPWSDAVSKASTALSRAIEQAQNVDETTLRAAAVAGPMGEDATSFPVAPGPFYLHDYWTHNEISEDYGGSEKVKTILRDLFRPPGLCLDLPPLFLDAETTTWEGTEYLSGYRATWWPGKDAADRAEAARAASYEEWKDTSYGDQFRDNGLDCGTAASYSGLSGTTVDQRSSVRDFSIRGTPYSRFRFDHLADLPHGIPDPLYVHPLKSAYSWRGRLVKTLHAVDPDYVLFTYRETVSNMRPSDMSGDAWSSVLYQVTTTGELECRGSVYQSPANSWQLPCGNYGDRFSMRLPAATSYVPVYDSNVGVSDGEQEDDPSVRRGKSSFTGSLSLYGFKPVRAFNGCPYTIYFDKSGETTYEVVGAVQPKDPEPFEESVDNRETEVTVEDEEGHEHTEMVESESLVSPFIPDDRWEYIKRAKLYMVADVEIRASAEAHDNMECYADNYSSSKTYYRDRPTTSIGRSGTSTRSYKNRYVGSRLAGSVVLDLGEIDPESGEASGSVDVYKVLTDLGCPVPDVSDDLGAIGECLSGFGPYTITRQGLLDRAITHRDGSGWTSVYDPPVSLNPDGSVPDGYEGVWTGTQNNNVKGGRCSHGNVNFIVNFTVKKMFVAIEWDFDATRQLEETPE